MERYRIKYESAGDTPNARLHSYIAVLTRVVLIIVGGYAASAGFVATLSALLPMLGFVRSEAVILGSMLAFVLYVTLVLWGFATHRSWRFLLTLVLLTGCGLVVFLTGAGR